MRNASIAVLREIGVETGGSNVQFAVNPDDGRMVVIEMNPRVSRSSALASKATGFPIAKVAAKLAVGYTLDELDNDITRRHAGLVRADHRLRRHQDPALRLREVPRRRPHADHRDEVGRRGDGDRPHLPREPAEGAARRWRPGSPASTRSRSTGWAPATTRTSIRAALGAADARPAALVAQAMRHGLDRRADPRRLQIDPWFLRQIAEIVDERRASRARPADARRAVCAR